MPGFVFTGGFESIWEIYEHTLTPINRLYLIGKDYQCKSNKALIVPRTGDSVPTSPHPSWFSPAR